MDETEEYFGLVFGLHASVVAIATGHVAGCNRKNWNIPRICVFAMSQLNSFPQAEKHLKRTETLFFLASKAIHKMIFTARCGTTNRLPALCGQSQVKKHDVFPIGYNLGYHFSTLCYQ